MHPRFASLACAALLTVTGASAPCYAALWSGTNHVVSRGQSTTMTISLTGDGLTDAADTDVALPPGVTIVSVMGRNGAQCIRLPKLGGARIFWFDASGAPLPAVDTPMCELRLRVTSSAAGVWLPLTSAVCAAGGLTVPCALDRGYVTITP